MISTTFSAIHESSPDVASSQNNSGGSESNSEANESLLISPPEMPFTRPRTPIRVSPHFIRPSWNGKKSFRHHSWTLMTLSKMMLVIEWGFVTMTPVICTQIKRWPKIVLADENHFFIRQNKIFYFLLFIILGCHGIVFRLTI